VPIDGAVVAASDGKPARLAVISPPWSAVPVRTPAEHPLRLHSWRLRFYTAETMFQPAPEAADEYLRGVLSAAASEVAGSDVPDLQGLLDCAGGQAGRQARLCQPLAGDQTASQRRCILFAVKVFAPITPTGGSCPGAAARREDPPCPWYRRYRGEYLRLLQFGEHESLDHPVACERMCRAAAAVSVPVPVQVQVTMCQRTGTRPHPHCL
jgi:hypothetical protein